MLAICGLVRVLLVRGHCVDRVRRVRLLSPTATTVIWRTVGVYGRIAARFVCWRIVAINSLAAGGLLAQLVRTRRCSNRRAASLGQSSSLSEAAGKRDDRTPV